MAKRVYIETTIISYLAARPSRDLIAAAHQQITRQWWEDRGPIYDLCVSQFVLDETGGGDADAAARRRAIVDPLSLLAVTPEAVDLSEALLAAGAFPPKAVTDALHMGVATVHGCDFLLTWNCKHLANAELQSAIASAVRSRGYEPPIICTPEELMGDRGD